MDAFNQYAEWYTWAVANGAGDAIARHAAVQALSVGGDPEIAARAASDDEAARDRTKADYGARHQYVEWFVWARANLHLPDHRCHEAARSALQSLSANGSSEHAREAAVRLMLPPAGGDAPTSRPTEWSSAAAPVGASRPADPIRSELVHQFMGDAMAAVVIGVISIGVPLLTPVYFPILPLFGLWRGALAVRAGRIAGGVVGLGVNLVAVLVSLEASGLLNTLLR